MKTLYTTILALLLIAPAILAHTKDETLQTAAGTYQLINSTTDLPVQDLVDGSTINLLQTGTQLNIRAIPSSHIGAVESVRFTSTGFSKTESAAPYAYQGDLNGDYYNWQPNVGTLVITVKYYSADGASGSLLGEDQISLHFSDQGDTTAPSAPNGLSSGTITDSSVQLSWNAASDDTAVTGYIVKQNGSTLANLGNVTTYTAIGLTPSTSYDFTVSALDAANNEGLPSNLLTVATTATPDTQAPTAVTLSLAGTSTSSISLSWNAATDNAGVSGYRIYDGTGNVLISLGNVLSHTLGNLSPGTAYTYAVSAVDAAGNIGTISNQVSASTGTISTTYGTYELIGSTDNTVRSLFLGGSTYNLDIVGDSLNIRAIPPQGSGVMSVKFVSADDNHSRTESTAPYAYFGDFADQYYHWHPPYLDAPMDITIFYYSGPSATGTVLGRDDLSVTFVDIADLEAPSMVSGISASNITDSSIRLDWLPSTDDRAVTAYTIYDGNALLATTTIPGHTLNGLAPGSLHHITIRALDASGKSSPSSTVLQVSTTDSVSPTIPTGLAASIVSPNAIDLSWNAATDNVAVTTYLLSINNAAPIALGDLTTHSLNGLDPGTSYDFKIAARDGAGNQSSYSLSIQLNTPATTNTFATYTLINSATDQEIMELFDGQAIDLNGTGRALNIDAVPVDPTNVGSVRFSSSDGYTAVETNAPYAYAYNIGPDFQDWEPPLGSLSFTVEYYTGSGATGSLIGTDQFTLTFTEGADIENPTPVQLSFGAATANSIPISWSTSQDNVGIAGYRLFQNGQLLSGGPLGPTITSYTATGLEADTNYNYVVRAFDAAGNQSDGQTFTARTAMATGNPPPSIPTGISGSPGPGSAYTLNWTPSTDNDLAGYYIYTDGLPTITVGVDDTYTIMGLNDFASYTFRVSAFDAAGNESGLSVPHQGIAGDGTPPSTGSLSVDQRGETHISISLNGFSDNSGSIDKYLVFVNGVQSMELQGTASNFILNGLILGNSYAIFVRASDASGNSSQTPVINVTTQTSTDTDSPAAPSLSLVNRDFESIAVSWDVPLDVSGIAAYRLFLEDVFTAELSGDQTQFTFTGLLQQESYGIKIVAVDGADNASLKSTELRIETTIAPGYQSVDLTDENYVYTRTFQVGKADHSTIAREKDVIEDIVYVDGLGRNRQQIAIKQSFDNKDIIIPMEYDSFGRQIKEYLPYEGGAQYGGLRDQAVAKLGVDSYYTGRYTDDLGNTPNTYSEIQYEASSLNRPIKQAAPGESWKMGSGHEIEFSYRTNTAGEVLNFEVDLSAGAENPVLETNAVPYVVGDLSKTITYDENHTPSSGKDHSTEEFTDKRGRVVLKRTYNEQEPHDTYYVYDDFNNLTFVLPPKVDTSDGVSALELSELCYQYRYDHRNRLVEKKIPGKEWEYIVYNILDQPILTQDPNLEAQGRWLFTKYDAFGRVAYTGFYDNAGSREVVQTAADAVAATFEEKTDTSFETLGGTKVNYTNTTFPTTGISELLTISYYDNYSFEGSPGLPASNGLGTSLLTAPTTQGLPTASLVKVLGTDQWAVTVTGYDEKRRPVYVRSHNPYLDALDIVDSKLDFLGRAEQVKSVHIKDGNDPIETLDTFTYDNSGRVLSQVQDLGGKRESIVQNEYDPMGLLVHKEVGGSPTNSLQSVDLTYNLRGWLTGINAPDLVTNSTGGNRLFAFAIHYDKSANGSTPLFNGNIGSTEWRTKNSSKKRRYYRYSYDALNRLKTAITDSWRYNLGSSSVPVSYDKNGNILRLYRRGHTSDNPVDSQNLGYGIMDDLNYTYDTGNKLLRVTDTRDKDYGFIDGNIVGDDYEYDLNGNLTLDRNKGITAITYNHLNLPTQVSVNGNENVGNISYIYMADGTKIEKIVNNQDPAGSSLTATEYCGNYVYERTGSAAADLKFFNHPEGYIEPDGQGGYDYIYQYKDHLGNIRLSYADDNGNGAIETGSSYTEIREENNYYPFGLKHKGYNNNQNGRDHKFEYNGIELEESLGLNLMEMPLRLFDPAIARWSVIDPVTHHWQSTYGGFDNNPIFWADPSGASVTRNDDGSVTIDGDNAAQAFINLRNAFGEDSDSEGDDTDPKKKKNKHNRRVVHQDPGSIDNFDGYTNEGDDSSPPLSELSEEERARRNSLFITIVTLPADATGLSSLGKAVLRRVVARRFIKQTFKSGTRKVLLQQGVRYFDDGIKGLEHFTKHGNSVMNALSKKSYSFTQYLDDANHVLNKGTFVPELNGYVKLIGGKGSAKFGFVGLNRTTGGITTFHLKTAKELAKKAPSLGIGL
ncbi:fibronectin type III domain-containing protein [Spongiimicrobium salis]|uniref:fibronectin type III domain-containing protein n=1 Tax=Spongiimicrobium salis TaxID=1667022 RepID=UPI00374CBE50